MVPGPPGPERPDRPRAGEPQRSIIFGQSGDTQGGPKGAIDWNAIFRALDDQSAPPLSGDRYQSQIKQEVDQVNFSPTISDRHQVPEASPWTQDAFDSSPFDVRPVPSRSQSYPNHWTDVQYETTAPNLDPPFWSTPLIPPNTVNPRIHPDFSFGSAFPASTSSSSLIDQTHSTLFRSLDQIEIPKPGDVLARPRSHSTQQIPLQHVRQDTISHTPPQNFGYSSVNPSPAPTPLSNPTSGEDSEDKRVRNTVASAKFRAKKKQQVAAVQRTITDLEIQQAGLEADVASLRRENGLLKEMVQLKFGTRIPEE